MYERQVRLTDIGFPDFIAINRKYINKFNKNIDQENVQGGNSAPDTK